MRTEPTPAAWIRLSGGALPFRIQDDGIVSVRVIGVTADGSLRLKLNGQAFVAASRGSWQPGDVFSACLRRSGSTLYLDPVPSSGASFAADVFARLEIPETPVSAFLVDFFRSSGYRLDPAAMKNCMRMASRFPGREKRIAEAAARLEMGGIEPTEALVSLCADALEGTIEPDDGRQRDILSFLNHKKGHECHWVVIPFRRVCGTRVLKGSVRFLLDTAAGIFKEALITVNDQERMWDFRLDSNSCVFGVNPSLPPSKFEQLIVYLTRQLSPYGIQAVEGGVPNARSRGGFTAVNLEI